MDLIISNESLAGAQQIPMFFIQIIDTRWNQLPKGKVSPAIATAVGIEDGSFVMTSWRGVQTSPATFQCTYNHMFSANIVCPQQI